VHFTFQVICALTPKSDSNIERWDSHNKKSTRIYCTTQGIVTVYSCPQINANQDGRLILCVETVACGHVEQNTKPTRNSYPVHPTPIRESWSIPTTCCFVALGRVPQIVTIASHINNPTCPYHQEGVGCRKLFNAC